MKFLDESLLIAKLISPEQQSLGRERLLRSRSSVLEILSILLHSGALGSLDRQALGRFLKQGFAWGQLISSAGVPTYFIRQRRDFVSNLTRERRKQINLRSTAWHRKR